jgi:hypothetical protein
VTYDPAAFDPPLTDYWEMDPQPGERPIAFGVSRRNLYLPEVDPVQGNTLVAVPLRRLRSVRFEERRSRPVLAVLGLVSAIVLWFSLGLPPPGGSFDDLAPPSFLCGVLGLFLPGWVAYRLPRFGRLIIEHADGTFAWDLPTSTQDRYDDARQIVFWLGESLRELGDWVKPPL